jgi:hypothetical protein
MRRIVSEVKIFFTTVFSVFQNLEKPTWLSRKNGTNQWVNERSWKVPKRSSMLRNGHGKLTLSDQGII